MITLTQKQQQEIENSLWVVNTALKRLGLSHDEDMRQTANLYLCQCLLRFDPTKNIKWTTYAYKNIYLYIKRVHTKELKKQSFLVADDILDLQHEPTSEDFEPLEDANLKVQCLMAVCSTPERRILNLKANGYKMAEIGEIMHCSISKVNMYVQSIKQKAKEIQGERYE